MFMILFIFYGSQARSETKEFLLQLGKCESDPMILPGCQTSNSASSTNFHHLALLALLVALVSHILNFHHWPLLALLVVLVLH